MSQGTARTGLGIVSHCDYAGTFDSQDGAWSLDDSMGRPGSTAGLGFGTQAQGMNYTRPKNYKLRTVQSVFSPYNLTFTAFRSMLFNLLPIWHEYFQLVEAAEEDAFAKGLEPLEEWPPFPVEQVRPALHRSVWMSLRDLSTLTVRRIYEKLAAQRCSPLTTAKLLKDARASATRKGYLPFYTRLYRIPQTYFRANILGAAADCTVSVVIDSYRVIYVPAQKGRVRRTGKQVMQRFWRILVADAFRCSTCLVVASVGAGLGALAFSPINRPGVGSLLGASAAEFGFTLFVVAPIVNDWAYSTDDARPRVTDDTAPHDGELLSGGD